MKKFLLVGLLLFSLVILAPAQKRPILEELIQVSHLPPAIPQKIFGIAFDGEKLWFSISHDKGHYATFDEITGEWKYSEDETHHDAIRQIAQPFTSASGIVFNGKTLWVGGSYGESLGSIDTETWRVEKNFKGKLRPDVQNSQVYSALAFEGTNLWAAWHIFEYKRHVSESQQLLKIDQNSGEVLERYPLPPGERGSGTHGLTFDGQTLWHIKGKKLSSINLQGRVLSQFILKHLTRPTGLAWDGRNLWIVEFHGNLWKLPLQ